MLELYILALALSMDAFAVSIGLGAKSKGSKLVLSILAGLYFGIFQGLMPYIGYIAGIGLMGYVDEYAHWLAFFLLAFIGGKMVYESSTASGEQDTMNVSHKLMLILAFATSIDAMAAGFSLTLLAVHPIYACLIIGLTTLIFSAVGVWIGDKSGRYLENKAELFGGIVLIAIGIRMLI